MTKEKAYFAFDFISALFIALFAYTAVDKLRHLPTFNNSLQGSTLLKNYEPVLRYAVPTIEMLLVVLLLLPKTRLAGLIGATTLMAVFTLYVGLVLSTPTNVPCSCGGIVASLSWSGHLWVNGIFTGLGTVAIVLFFYFFYRDKTGHAEHL